MIDKDTLRSDAPEATIRELLTQISRRNERLTYFRTRIAALEEEVARERVQATEASSKLARAEDERARTAALLKENQKELSAVKKRLARLERSMGVRMILAFRRSMGRIAPEGTHRRRMILLALSVPRRLVSSRSRPRT